MTVWKKLNLKDQREVVVLDAPASFEAEIAALDGVKVRRSAKQPKQISFAVAFATKQSQVDAAADAVVPKLADDGIIWIAYPKGSSRRYTCEFNRDTGWARLGEHGFEPVRQVAIDEDWSALRFRRVDHIKSMTRSFAMTEQGKERVKARVKARDGRQA